MMELEQAQKLIKERFRRERLPKPVTINYIGKWAHGDCYAVTCCLIRLKKYCVYFKDDEITSIRKR